MSIVKRLNSIQNQIDLNESLFPKMPDFDNMTELELDEYMQAGLTRSHNEQKIFSYAEAVRTLENELKNNLIDKKDFDLLVIAEKTFWNIQE